MKKIILFVIALSLIAGSLLSCNESEEVIPVIVGVKESITVYADDPYETVLQMLLDGVTTEGGDPTTVIATVFDKAANAETKLLTAGEYEIHYTAENSKVNMVTSVLTVKPADTTEPEFSGIKDLVVNLGDTVSYREGVTVTDNDDQSVTFSVDASKVDLTRLGKYEVTYTATDKRGNTASVTSYVTVVAALEGGNDSNVCTREELDQLCQSILDQILTEGMTERQIAEAIYEKVNKIKYASTADTTSWVTNAWLGLTKNKGDCVNHEAAAKALLTMAGIPNYSVSRVGGTSDHFWLIVCVEGKWYHFDACPTLKAKPFRCFLKTESEVAAYTAQRPDKPNYYVYDKENCPYDVED